LSTDRGAIDLASRELSLFSYEVLGLVGRQGAGAHDLRRLAKQAPFFNWAGDSQYYTEPKRLARLGYLSARKERGKTRERTVYSLTDQGLDALREWARTEVGFTPVKSEVLIRLLICDLVGEPVTRESIATLRDDIADIERRLDDAAERAVLLPHREKYLLLAFDFMRGLLELHSGLIDEVQAQLDDGTAFATARPPRHQRGAP
jgi:DNA-binding PadR family transcriptional regulator